MGAPVVLATWQPLLSLWQTGHIFRAGRRISQQHGVGEEDSASSSFKAQLSTEKLCNFGQDTSPIWVSVSVSVTGTMPESFENNLRQETENTEQRA